MSSSRSQQVPPTGPAGRALGSPNTHRERRANAETSRQWPAGHGLGSGPGLSSDLASALREGSWPGLHRVVTGVCSSWGSTGSCEKGQVCSESITEEGHALVRDSPVLGASSKQVKAGEFCWRNCDPASHSPDTCYLKSVPGSAAHHLVTEMAGESLAGRLPTSKPTKDTGFLLAICSWRSSLKAKRRTGPRRGRLCTPLSKSGTSSPDPAAPCGLEPRVGHARGCRAGRWLSRQQGPQGSGDREAAARRESQRAAGTDSPPSGQAASWHRGCGADGPGGILPTPSDQINFRPTQEWGKTLLTGAGFGKSHVVP